MKSIKLSLACILASLLLSIMSFSSFASNRTVTVKWDESSINSANCTATLEDGTVLGFRMHYDDIYFCGAISQQTELAVPDSIVLENDTICYPVIYIGDYYVCDFSMAESVKSLYLPSTIKMIYSLPSSIKILHTNNYIENCNYSCLLSLDKIYVSESDCKAYMDDSNWYYRVQILPEGTDPLKVTINMTKPGEFAQMLLEQVDHWNMVKELTVVGELNEDDLNVFQRMCQLVKLDLSQAIIADIPNYFAGTSNYDYGYGCFSLLEELYLPELNSIGAYAFAQSRRLKTIEMPKVNAIGNAAFAQLGADRISLPEGIKTIGSRAFYHCRLSEIELPSTIGIISDYCFCDCDSIKSVTIPSSVTEIGDYAFGYCDQLSQVVFNEGLLALSDYAFRECYSLSEIDLPSTLIEMGSSVFYNCYNLKKVKSRAVVPPSAYNGSMIYGCDMTDVKLYTPAMSIDAYRAEDGWKSFYTILPLEEKSSNIYVYKNVNIEDASEVAENSIVTINYRYSGYNNQYTNGALEYSGSTTLSMQKFHQKQDMGSASNRYGDDFFREYAYDSHFTSLISDGIMRSDSVLTTLETSSSNIWYFISLPYDVKVSDIIYPEDTQFVIRKYSGLNRAQQSGSTWLNLSADSIMHAYEGYILKCNKDGGAEFTFPAINNANKNKVFEKESVTIALGEYLSEYEHNRSWNLIGNPYPCYYDTRFMDFTAPVTVWNRYYERYDAYSPIDDEFILHPSQSFFVQRPVDQSSICFDKAGRQKDLTVRDIEPQVETRAAISSNRKVFNLMMSDGSSMDRARVVMNANAAQSYELDKDASKFIPDDNTAMLIYTIENGVKYAINERPMGAGLASIGFYAPADGEYTISCQTNETDNLILIDSEKNTETALIEGYSFNASAGYNESRFTVKFSGSTSIESINIDNGQVSADKPFSVYTIDGRLIGSFTADSSVNLAQGLYVIKCNDFERTIVVK